MIHASTDYISKVAGELRTRIREHLVASATKPPSADDLFIVESKIERDLGELIQACIHEGRKRGKKDALDRMRAALEEEGRDT